MNFGAKNDGYQWFDECWEIYARCGDKGKKDEPKALDNLIEDVLYASTHEHDSNYDRQALERYLQKREPL